MNAVVGLGPGVAAFTGPYALIIPFSQCTFLPEVVQTGLLLLYYELLGQEAFDSREQIPASSQIFPPALKPFKAVISAPIPVLALMYMAAAVVPATAAAATVMY